MKTTLEQRILEAYQEEKIYNSIETFLVSISENYDIEISEDCTVSDLFDCLYEFFKDDESFMQLEKALTPLQKKAYAKRSKGAKKNKGAENTAKVTAKKKVKAATPEKPETKPATSKKPSTSEKPEVKPTTSEKPEVKPATSEKPDTTEKPGGKPEGPSKTEQIEKLRDEVKSISDEIKSNRDKLNNLDTSKPESKSVADSLNATIISLEKKKLPLDQKVAKLEDDEERQERLNNLEPIIDKKAELFAAIKKIHVLQDSLESEEDEEKRSGIKAEIERAKSDKEKIAGELDDLRGNSGEAESEAEAEITKDKEKATADKDKEEADKASRAAKLDAEKATLSGLKDELSKATDKKDRETIKAKIADSKKRIADIKDEGPLPDDYKETDNSASDADSDKKEGEMDDAADKAEDEKSKQEQIDELEKQIEAAVTGYDNYVKSVEEGIKNQKETTNKLVGGTFGKANFFCWLFIMKQRNEARLEFLEKLESLIPNKKTQEALAEQIVKAKEALKKTQEAFDEKAKTGEESAKEEDPEKLADATSAGASGEDVDMTASKSEDKPESKKEDDEESKSPEERNKELKKEEIDISLEKLTNDLGVLKDALKKAKEEGKDTDGISKNYFDIADAIKKLKSEKEKLGESFGSIELEIWALGVAITSLLEQIESGYLFE